MTSPLRFSVSVRRTTRFAVAALVLPAFAGCFDFGGSAPASGPAQPTIRQVRAEWREMERNGLLPLLQEPLAPEEDLSERLAPAENASMTHPRETNAALARLQETAEQIENPETREAFLEADRKRDLTRTGSLETLFGRRANDGVAADTVGAAWQRLDQAFAALEQDEWVESQRLLALKGMLRANAAASTPRLIEALQEGLALEDLTWRALIANLPAPAAPNGRPMWRELGELELSGEPARGVLQRLASGNALAGLPHPLSSPEETALLLEWMESDEPTDFALKKAILSNAEYLEPDAAESLYEMGENDPSTALQIHALYCAAELSEDEARIRRLVELCDDERYAGLARQRLQMLGKAYRARPSGDPLRKARELAYESCSSLRYQVDATPEELTLIARSTVDGEAGEPPMDVFVFSYRLPDVAKSEADEALRQQAIASGSQPATLTAYEELEGYAVAFGESAYVSSMSEAQAAKCETALDVAAMTHRDYFAYEWDEETAEKPVPEYAEELAAKDWRWGELRVPLKTDEGDDEADDGPTDEKSDDDVGLLRALEEPLAAADELFARIDGKLVHHASRAAETDAAVERLRETIGHLEDESTRDAFLVADRQRETSRTETLALLFGWELEESPPDATDATVVEGLQRLDQAFARLEQDAWIEDQRLALLRCMVRVDAAKSADRLLAAIEVRLAEDNDNWWLTILELPRPSTEEGRPIWTAISRQGDLQGEIALAVLMELGGEESLGDVAHPFDNEPGMAVLRERLESTDPFAFDWQRRALENAKHFAPERAEELYRLGEKHSSKRIQALALLEGCHDGEDAERLRRLHELRDDERYAGYIGVRLRQIKLLGDQEYDWSSLRSMREQAYWLGADLRSDVDATPAELTLVAEAKVSWENDDETVRVFRYRLPDYALRDAESPHPGSEGVRSILEDVQGFIVFSYEGYAYSQEEVDSKGYATALEIAAMAHRAGDDYGEEPLPEVSSLAIHVQSLIGEDSRWEKLRVPLPVAED